MRGIFYSLIAMMFVVPLVMLTVFTAGTQTTYSTTKALGNKLASYSESIADDLPRAVSIMAKRSIGDAIVYIDTNGVPLDDSEAALNELITNGTLYGNVSSVDFTMKSWTNILRQKGEEYGFTTSVMVISMKFYSPDSYTINVEAVIGVNASSPGAEMELYRIYNNTVPISIKGLNDPLYTLKTNGIIKRGVESSNVTIQGTAAFDHAAGLGLYMPSTEGAGFMDRLEGRLRGSGKYNTTQTAGLESVVYLPGLQANGIPVDQTKTCMDYLYFDTTYYSGYTVNGSTYGWLKVDSEHAGIYGLTTV